jgi:hypothetical protein
MKLLKYIFYFFSLFFGGLFILYLVVVNVKLYHTPTFSQTSGKTYRQDVYFQLQYLKEKMRKGAGQKMQKIYPEGFVFMHALYGLSWTDLIQNLPTQDAIYQEGMQEIEKSLQKLYSPEAQNNFPNGVKPSLGAFYNGWTAYLLGKKLTLQTHKDSLSEANFKRFCTNLALAYQDKTYLPSYADGIWQADNVVCMATLALHDKIYTPHYETLRQDWIAKVGKTLDTNELLPHSASDEVGKIQEMARGSSLSLMLCFLPEIDKEFAEKQYKSFQEYFFAYRLGLLGVREYPLYDNNGWGSSDIDSGPILWGIGGVASIVGIRACLKNRDTIQAQKLRNSIEAFGLSITWNKQKYYLGGSLEVVDAFMAWANVSQQQKDKSYVDTGLLLFHFISLSIIILLLLIFKMTKPL